MGTCEGRDASCEQISLVRYIFGSALNILAALAVYIIYVNKWHSDHGVRCTTIISLKLRYVHVRAVCWPKIIKKYSKYMLKKVILYMYHQAMDEYNATPITQI